MTEHLEAYPWSWFCQTVSISEVVSTYLTCLFMDILWWWMHRFMDTSVYASLPTGASLIIEPIFRFLILWLRWDFSGYHDAEHILAPTFSHRTKKIKYKPFVVKVIVWINRFFKAVSCIKNYLKCIFIHFNVCMKLTPVAD